MARRGVGIMAHHHAGIGIIIILRHNVIYITLNFVRDDDDSSQNILRVARAIYHIIMLLVRVRPIRACLEK